MAVRISDLPDLPVYNPEIQDMVAMASIDSYGVTRRVSVSENVFQTEQEAIERIIQIYRTGGKAFILPYKE